MGALSGFFFLILFMGIAVFTSDVQLQNVGPDKIFYIARLFIYLSLLVGFPLAVGSYTKSVCGHFVSSCTVTGFIYGAIYGAIIPPFLELVASPFLSSLLKISQYTTAASLDDFLAGIGVMWMFMLIGYWHRNDTSEPHD